MDVDEAKVKGKEKDKLVDVGLDGDTGSSLIGQILGFKFFHYQVSSPLGHGVVHFSLTLLFEKLVGAEEAPEKLYLMSALLIWHGFVKLSDLWPHVSSVVLFSKPQFLQWWR